MKKYRLSLVVAILFCISIISCKKEQLATVKSTEYFSFGRGGGYCGNECPKYYFLIENNNLYQNIQIKGSLIYKDSALATEKYILAKNVLDSLPDYLLKSTEKYFGCPNCYDQGFYDIEYHINGNIYKWQLDPNYSSVPIELKDFVELVGQTINKLKD